MDGLEIVPLTPERAGDFLHLFDGPGFADNPDWSGCFCRFYHYDHDAGDWGGQSGAVNRSAACDLIAARRMRGWLAMLNGEAVGWINAARKDSYAALAGDDVPGADPVRTGMIVCFLIAPDYRGRGLARLLMQAAIAGFRQQGLSAVEAKPAINPQRAASNYHGPFAMYLSAGFEHVGEFSEHQHLVRLAL